MQLAGIESSDTLRRAGGDRRVRPTPDIRRRWEWKNIYCPRHSECLAPDAVHPRFDNFVAAWQAAPFGRFYLNSVITAASGVVLEVLIAALSGFGLMASLGAGELLAAHLAGKPLPEYAPAFSLQRYQDPEGAEEGWHHLIRGSSWKHAGISDLRTAYRD